jgi:hypothetical protein
MTLSSLGFQASRPQFERQGNLIYRFQQSRPEFPVDGNSRLNNDRPYLILCHSLRLRVSARDISLRTNVDKSIFGPNPAESSRHLREHVFVRQIAPSLGKRYHPLPQGFKRPDAKLPTQDLSRNVTSISSEPTTHLRQPGIQVFVKPDCHCACFHITQFLCVASDGIGHSQIER